MKHYTDTIPLSLAEKLKEKGMPIFIEQEWYSNGMPKAEKDCHKPMTQYGQVFDWLIEKGWFISIGREYDFATEQVTERFEWSIEKVGCFSSQPYNGAGWCNTWHEAADAAIEKTLELI